MKKKNQPSREEVLEEMLNGIKIKFSKVGNSIKDISVMYSGAAMVMVVAPYIVPSCVRFLREPQKSNKSMEINAEFVGGIAGVLTGFLVDFKQIEFYYDYAVNKDHPEILLIPIATNIASGIYEIGKKMYNNSKQRLLDKHKPNNL